MKKRHKSDEPFVSKWPVALSQKPWPDYGPRISAKEFRRRTNDECRDELKELHDAFNVEGYIFNAPP